MDKPRRRENPVFHAFIEITVIGVSRQHAVEDRAHDRRPFFRFFGFVHQSISRDRQTRRRNKRVILRISISSAVFRFEKIIHDPRLTN